MYLTHYLFYVVKIIALMGGARENIGHHTAAASPRESAKVPHA